MPFERRSGLSIHRKQNANWELTKSERKNTINKTKGVLSKIKVTFAVAVGSKSVIKMSKKKNQKTMQISEAESYSRDVRT